MLACLLSVVCLLHCSSGVTLLMVVWWLFEVLPLGVTSFMPVVLFPLMGIVPGTQVPPTTYHHCPRASSSLCVCVARQGCC